MIVYIPIPGYITKRIQGTQREKMHKVRHAYTDSRHPHRLTTGVQTDERVQFVTESTHNHTDTDIGLRLSLRTLTVMGVIRMIKLFGWEPRIREQLDEKREAELVAVRKNRLFGLWNDLCK